MNDRRKRLERLEQRAQGEPRRQLSGFLMLAVDPRTLSGEDLERYDAFRRELDEQYLLTRADVLAANPAYRSIAERCRALDVEVPGWEWLCSHGVDVVDLAIDLAGVADPAEAVRLIHAAPTKARGANDARR